MCTALAAAVLGLPAGGCGGDNGEQARSTKENAPVSARVVAKIAAPGAGEVAVGAGAVWITDGAGTVSRIDPDRNKVVARVKVGGPEVCCIAFGEGDVWVSDFGRDTVSRIDAKTNSVVDRIPVAPAPHGLAVAHGSAWVAHEHDGTVGRIDPARHALVGRVRIGPAGSNGPLDVVAAAGSIWVSVPSAGEVVRIDPATNRVTARISVLQPCAFAAAADAIWIGGCGRTEITRIDPTTNGVMPIVDPSQDSPGKPALDPPYLWAVTFSGSLVRIDTRSSTITGKVPLEGFNIEGESVAVGFESLWVRARDTVLRLESAPSG